MSLRAQLDGLRKTLHEERKAGLWPDHAYTERVCTYNLMEDIIARLEPLESEDANFWRLVEESKR